MGHKKRRKKTKTEKAQTALSKGLKRLEPEQGMVARRNARKAVLAALKALRKAVDDEYPVIRKKPSRTGPLSRAARTRKMRAKGYVEINGVGRTGRPIHDISLEMKAAGIPVRDSGLALWIPRWARDLYVNIEKMTRESRSTILELAAKRGHSRTRAQALGHVVAATGAKQYSHIIGEARAVLKRDINTARAVIAAAKVGDLAVRQLVEDLDA